MTADVDRHHNHGPGVPSCKTFEVDLKFRFKVCAMFVWFDCVLCRHARVYFPLWASGKFDDQTQSAYFEVRLSSATPRDTDQLGEKEKLELLQELMRVLVCDNLSNIRLQRARLDDQQSLQIEYRVRSRISVAVGIGNETTSVLNGSYVMRVEDVGLCSSAETIDSEVATMINERTVGSFKFAVDETTGDITSRECRFDYYAFRADWDPEPSRWTIIWRTCSSPYDQYSNEELYLRVLSADVKRRHTDLLREFTSTPVNTTTFSKIAAIVNTVVEARHELDQKTSSALVNITASVELDTDNIVAKGRRSFIIVADLTASEPVVGFTVEYWKKLDCSEDNITLNRSPTLQGRAPFAFDVSGRLREAHSRVAFVVVWKEVKNARMRGLHYRRYQYPETTVIFPLQGEVSEQAFTSYASFFVDITYDESAMLDTMAYDKFYNFLTCLAWNNDLRDWNSKGCSMKYTNQSNFGACRCSGRNFFMQDGVPVGKYALQKGLANNARVTFNNPLTDFLKDKIGLMTATAIECLLSALGLGSIICTAICIKHWRENVGHKILLHMVGALTCNLVLGFTANFVRMTTDSIGCLVYGVLRHYSFLAMFFWMLVLSCLQLRRLTTVAGAKATTHLVLKASAFAWGVPLVPIIVLLSWDYGFYQRDRFERGYCYPEGSVFQVTVQAPAGLILFVNLCIFVKILLHIFGCNGEKKITRHTKNERAEQLKKLKTSLFIFVLFGFSWVFHIFSEERIIVSDFLFEYLFLMTATTHIFTLSLFFVVFQESTQKEWSKLLRTSVRKVRGRV